MEHLHICLRNDLKLSSMGKNCQKAMNSIYEKKERQKLNFYQLMI